MAGQSETRCDQPLRLQHLHLATADNGCVGSAGIQRGKQVLDRKTGELPRRQVVFRIDATFEQFACGDLVAAECIGCHRHDPAPAQVIQSLERRAGRYHDSRTDDFAGQR